jgi:hypothetical protein
MAANNHLFAVRKQRPHTKKKSITPSKCRLPVSSIIIRGFRKYQKIRCGDLFKWRSNFFPK